MFRYLVLGLLRDGEPRHGYAVMKEYRERSGLQVNTGSFYRELQRLVAEGLVRTVANPIDADPRRAPYELTAAGAACFDAWLCGPTGAGVGRYEDELSARAMFLTEAEPAVVRKLLEGWKEELWLKSKVHERTRRAVVGSETDAATSPFSTLPLLLARSLKHVTADIEFIDELSGAYEAWLEQSRATVESRQRRDAPAVGRRRQSVDKQGPR